MALGAVSEIESSTEEIQMKTFLNLIVLIATGLFASAQTPGVYILGPFNGGTNNIAGSTTSTPGSTIACSEFDNVGIQFGVAAMSASTSPVILSISKSLDGSTYETTPSILITNTLNGATAVVTVNTFSIPSAATLKLVSINNGATPAITNITIKVRFKAPKAALR
jgi:hypothetical protein